VVLRILRKNWLWILAAAGLAALVVAVNPGRLGHVFRDVDKGVVALMVPTTLCIFVVRGIGWWFTLHRIGIRLPVVRVVAVVFASKPMVFLPAGDLGRVAVLESTGAQGHDAGEVASTVAFQEMVFLGLMAIPLIPALIVEPPLIPILVLLVVLLGAVLVLLLWPPAYERAISLIEHFPFLRRFDRELHHIRPAFIRLFEARTLAGVVVFDAIGVALTFFLFELALHAVGVENVGILQATFVYAVAYLVSGLTFTPVGIGAYEGIITGFMVLQGVAPSEGAAAALLYRGFNDVFMAGVGLVALLVLRRIAGPARRDDRALTRVGGG
jgi:uncharacterized membrane protein YbhN (UPF0104 family)